MRRFLLLIVALIAYGSLYPLHFEFAATVGNPAEVLLQGWPAEWNVYILRDVILNVLIYIPLGLVTFLALRRRYSAAVAFGGGVALGYLLSMSMELLQVYVPGRTPSLLDLLTNTAGSLAGAGFAFVFEDALKRVGERRDNRFRDAALLLLMVWAVCQLYPVFPQLSRGHLRQELSLLAHFPRPALVETWANAAEWFAVGLALDAVFTRMRTAWLAAAMLCVPAQLVIASRTLTVEELLGALLALVLWHWLPPASRATCCAWMLGSAVLLRQLEPFYFLGVPQAFSWIPFGGTFESNREVAVVTITRKTFDYAALVWALRRAGMRYWLAGLAVVALLAVTEALQTYLPGRTPEVTDPLLALLMTVVLQALSRKEREGA